MEKAEAFERWKQTSVPTDQLAEIGTRYLLGDSFAFQEHAFGDGYDAGRASAIAAIRVMAEASEDKAARETLEAAADKLARST